MIMQPLLGYKAAASAATYRYFRLNITANGGSATWLYVNELEIYVGATKYPTSTMIGNTNPSPLVASASVNNSPNFAYKVFNNVKNSIADMWNPGSGITTGWVQVDLGAGNEIAPTSFAVTADGTAASGTTRYPKDYQFQGSNDGSTWTTLKSVTGATFGSLTTQTHTIP